MERYAIVPVLITMMMFAFINQADTRTVEMDRNLKIVGGLPARVAQFPHAAALVLSLVQSGTTSTSFCGGSIINQHFILTAAHCLDDVVRIEVFAGMNTLWEGNPAYRATVERRDIRPHPQYSRETLINDIGLVFVLRRFVFSNLVQRIALPPQSEMNNRFLGSAATVIGWGWTNDSHQVLSHSLRFVTLPIIADQTCIDVYNSNFRYFNPTNICISGAQGSTCNGDSGGGMHLMINGQLSLIGVVSYGSSTCESGHPPVMTRVTAYMDWISANTGIRL